MNSIEGIIVVYKEKGCTSHDVVDKVRDIVGVKKVGHTGTLDPLATGVLPVLLGEYTKLSILSPSKKYLKGVAFSAPSRQKVSTHLRKIIQISNKVKLLSQLLVLKQLKQ